MNKLVLVDGHAIMYRAFHAMPPLTSKSGQPINAVYGLVSMLLKVITDLKPTHIAIVFDEKEPTFRKKELPTYQAQRVEMPKELDSQFDKAKEFLKAAKINVYSKSGFEADDVIGTLAKQATQILNSKFEILIVTGDRDILQLVDNKKNIKLFMPIGGLSNGKIFTEIETVERMGVYPSQIADLKALTGDPSDNYFGVPGIGPKTAVNLLSEYKSFENIYKNLNKLKGKVKEKLEQGKESGELSYKLATIITNVPVEFNFSEMDKWKLDSKEVIELFTNKFGFKTLTERIKKIGKQIEEEKQGTLFV